MTEMHVNDSYDCVKDGHIVGQWMPTDQFHVRRVCVIPGCHTVESREVRK